MGNTNKYPPLSNRSGPKKDCGEDENSPLKELILCCIEELATAPTEPIKSAFEACVNTIISNPSGPVKAAIDACIEAGLAPDGDILAAVKACIAEELIAGEESGAIKAAIEACIVAESAAAGGVIFDAIKACLEDAGGGDPPDLKTLDPENPPDGVTFADPSAPTAAELKAAAAAIAADCPAGTLIKYGAGECEQSFIVAADGTCCKVGIPEHDAETQGFTYGFAPVPIDNSATMGNNTFTDILIQDLGDCVNPFPCRTAHLEAIFEVDGGDYCVPPGEAVLVQMLLKNSALLAGPQGRIAGAGAFNRSFDNCYADGAPRLVNIGGGSLTLATGNIPPGGVIDLGEFAINVLYAGFQENDQDPVTWEPSIYTGLRVRCIWTSEKEIA